MRVNHLTTNKSTGCLTSDKLKMGKRNSVRKRDLAAAKDDSMISMPIVIIGAAKEMNKTIINVGKR